ncbi:hypothetical protein [Salarchaeum japonicum]|uniref:Uncharacterized protein n=1 Tax=Salarchaeum japonicum TaxID=555573 RepID=A0AAV3T3B2_9EURY|nr:hypothetical protein [Salarchaeum japonicum]
MGLTTGEIMQVSLDLVGWDDVPGDSTTYVPGDDIETALVGIDLESPEIQLAHREGFDLALAHHPAGDDARLDFTDVLDKQVEFMTAHGVPEDEAEDAADGIREGAEYGAHAANYRHNPSIAEYLDQPYMNVHLAPDELGRRAFVDVVETLDESDTVADLTDAFNAEFEEIREARTDIETRVGADDNELGEVAVHHAAGTNGGADVARAYFENGVDTVIYIHVSASDAAELREEYDDKNLVVTGHIASDAIGLNEYIAALEDAGVDCTTISGCGL